MSEASYDYTFRVFSETEGPVYFLSFTDMMTHLRKKVGHTPHLEGSMIPGYFTWVYSSKDDAKNDPNRDKSLFRIKTLAG